MASTNAVRSSMRDRVFEAAAELFAAQGIRGVGVDAIAKRASTTKMGLYRHFASKDALIADWLAEVVRQRAAVCENLAAQYPDDARRQIAGLAQFVAADVSRSSHRGCPLMNSIAELPDQAHPGRRLVVEHKARQLDHLADLCKRAGARRPRAAAVHLTLVLEGAHVAAQNGSVTQLGPNLLAAVDSILACMAA